MSYNDSKPRSVSFNDDNVSQEGEARRANDAGTYSVRISSPSKIRPSYESSDLSTQYVLDKANQALRKSFLVTQSSPSKSHYVSSSPIRSSYIPSSTTVSSGTAGVAKTYEILAKANDALRKSNVATSSTVTRAYSPSRRDYASVATDILVSEALRKSAIARSRSPSPSKYRAAPVTSVSSYIRDLENARLHNALRKSQELVHEIKRSQEVVHALKRSQDLTNALRKSQEIQRVNEIVRRNEEINRLNNALRKSQEIRAAETLRKSQELRADLRTAEILRKSQEIRAVDALRKSQEIRRALSPVYYDPLPSTVISDYLRTSYQSDRFYNALKKSQEIVNAKIVSDLRKSQEIRKALNESAGSFGSPRRARDANDAYTDALRRSTSLLAKEADKSLERSFVIDRSSGSPSKERALSASVRSTASDGLRYVDERYSDGSSYRGDKLNLLKHGKGEFVYADGRRYQGEWAFDRRHGYGVLRENNGLIIYDGEWKDGVYHGNGTLYNNNSRFETEFTYLDFNTLGLAWVKYDGEFYEGQWHGLGTLTILNNQKYSGKFRFDRVNGTGTFYKSNGLAVSGEWLENKFIRAY